MFGNSQPFLVLAGVLEHTEEADIQVGLEDGDAPQEVDRQVHILVDLQALELVEEEHYKLDIEVEKADTVDNRTEVEVYIGVEELGKKVEAEIEK